MKTKRTIKQQILSSPPARALIQGAVKLGFALISASAKSRRKPRQELREKDNKQVPVMTDLNALFAEMKNRFNPSAAANMEAVFQYDITDGTPWFVTIENGDCAFAEGESDDPTVTLSMDSVTLNEVMTGETDGMQAFMTGRIKASGDIMLATKLAALFPEA
ncbi:SCP2 sterol-binding domain-containing protein [Sessilibacter sp. MAH2]